LAKLCAKSCDVPQHTWKGTPNYGAPCTIRVDCVRVGRSAVYRQWKTVDSEARLRKRLQFKAPQVGHPGPIAASVPGPHVLTADPGLLDAIQREPPRSDTTVTLWDTFVALFVTDETRRSWTRTFVYGKSVEATKLLCELLESRHLGSRADAQQRKEAWPSPTLLAGLPGTGKSQMTKCCCVGLQSRHPV